MVAPPVQVAWPAPVLKLMSGLGAGRTVEDALSILETQHAVSRDRVDETVAEGRQAADLAEEQLTSIAATDPATWRDRSQRHRPTRINTRQDWSKSPRSIICVARES